MSILRIAALGGVLCALAAAPAAAPAQQLMSRETAVRYALTAQLPKDAVNAQFGAADQYAVRDCTRSGPRSFRCVVLISWDANAADNNPNGAQCQWHVRVTQSADTPRRINARRIDGVNCVA
jgi:hypothetical protein